MVGEIRIVPRIRDSVYRIRCIMGSFLLRIYLSTHDGDRDSTRAAVVASVSMSRVPVVASFGPVIGRLNVSELQ